jgi:hypothetical protein
MDNRVLLVFLVSGPLGLMEDGYNRAVGGNNDSDSCRSLDELRGHPILSQLF